MYASDVDGQTLTFQVSGQLWRRSLVMRDVETETLWSHIPGKAVKGRLEGTMLERIPSDMLTWSAWKQRHPDTTVLNMSRTREHYTPEFVKNPDDFVVGFPGEQPRHCSFTTLQQTPLLNTEADGELVLIVFDPQSTSILVFSRELDDRVLTFSETGHGTLRDEPTGSIWDRTSGESVDGPLKGSMLSPRVGIVSYTRAWMTFHPDSVPVEVSSVVHTR